MGTLKAYPMLVGGLFCIHHYGGQHTGLYSAAPLIKTRSLFLHPLNWASLMTCFDQKNVVKVMFCEFSGSGFEATASAFLVLRPLCPKPKIKDHTERPSCSAQPPANLPAECRVPT